MTTNKNSSIWSQYSGVRAIFRRYWRAYGGWRAVLTSPYAGASMVITVLSAGLWWTGSWCDVALSVLPNLLGFSLGGYAMLVGFGDDKFKALLSETRGNDDVVLFMSVSASFVHFIVMQALALLVALVSKALSSEPALQLWAELGAEPLFAWASRAGWCLGFLLFSYALTLTVASTMSIFRLTGWLVSANSKTPPNGGGTAQ